MELNLAWSAPKTVNTRVGERLLRTAATTPEFWEIWKLKKDELKAAGYSVTKNRAGQWEVAHWSPLSQEKQEAKQAAVEASRAVSADVNYPAPPGKEYFPFQRAGIQWMLQRESTLLGDDMGLGKTMQIIGVMNAEKPQRTLIVCPATMRLNWAEKLKEWLVYSRKIAVIDGKAKWPKDPQIVVINFEQSVRHEKSIRSTEWDLIAVDEGHYLKNPKAKRTKALFGEFKNKKWVTEPVKAKKRIVATGTAIVNRPVELFPILNWLDPKSWPNFFYFAKRYADAKHNGWGWDFSGASNLDELQSKLRSSVMIRRLKREVLTELPEKTWQAIELPANGLAGVLAREREIADRKEIILTEMALARARGDEAFFNRCLLELKGVETAGFEEMSRIRHEIGLGKVDHAVEHLLSASGKVIVFTHHRDVLEGIKAGLEAEGKKCVVIWGDMDDATKKASEDAFQDDPSVDYFLGTIGACSEGITLTASSHVVFIEFDWRPGKMTQAEDRAHRIGQRNAVLIQYLVFNGSLDARMAHTKVTKQAVITAALDAPVKAPEIVAAQSEFDWQAAMDELVRTKEAVEAEAKAAKAKGTIERSTASRLGGIDLDAEAAKLTATVIKSIHQGIRLLASLDPDRASEENFEGYSATDGRLGHALASRPELHPREAVLAKFMLRKYKRQLGGIYEAIYG